MICDICRRAHSARLPFLCAVDARNQLYEVRLQHVRTLIENEHLEHQIHDHHLRRRESTQSNATVSGGVSRAQLDSWRSEAAQVAHRTQHIIAQADRFRREIEQARSEIATKKEDVARRRSDLAMVSNGLDARRKKQLEDFASSISELRYAWSNMGKKIATTRAYLCEESARLYGLRQVKRGGNARWYEIGGVEIVELHAMNHLPPEVLSTSLAHIVHLLVLASTFLAVRLPAEISAPRDDYPRPTIFSVNSSYRHGEVAFPGSVLAAQANETQRTPRPRPLFIDKPLPQLSKDDPATHAYFVEGVALLAYDVAWLCCSQGVSVGDRDVYNIGQNLWRLLIGDQLYRKSMEPAFPASGGGGGGGEESQKPPSHIGHWSHGSLAFFLGGAEGAEYVRGFKLPSPAHLVDTLKKKLSSEAPILEWEKIDSEEAEECALDGGMVSVRDRRRSGGVTDSALVSDLGIESIVTDIGSRNEDDAAAAGGGGVRGMKGWTKLSRR